jgi:glycosyltransferase involved in cell wall biosynthesis
VSGCEEKRVHLRILILSWEYPPYKIGGIAEHVYELSGALSRKGLEVHVVTVGHLPYEKSGQVHIHRIALDAAQPGFIGRLNNEMMLIGSSIMESNSTSIDLIHAHDWMVGNAAIDLAWRFQKPLVSTIHSTEFGRSHGITDGYQMKIHELEKQLVDSSEHIIVCSESMRGELQGLFGVTENVSVIPNGVDVSKFDFSVDGAALKHKFCGAKKPKMIVFLGRLVRQKGVNVLIGALHTVVNSFSRDVHLVIIGEGPMRQQLEWDAAYLGISNHITFTGYLDDHSVRSLLKAADVIVFPSLYEPFGIVALEAMAAQTPIVATDVGGLSELISDGEGVKVPPDNSKRLAEGIINLLSYDDSAKKRMVEKAFRKVRSLSWDTIADATIDVYAKIVSSFRTSLATAPQRNIEIAIEPAKDGVWRYLYS